MHLAVELIHSESFGAHDVVAVGRGAASLLANIRTGCGPALIFMTTYRMAAHSKGDDDRDPREIARHGTGDPIDRLRHELDDAWCMRTEQRVRERVDSIVQSLKKKRLGARGP